VAALACGAVLACGPASGDDDASAGSAGTAGGGLTSAGGAGRGGGGGNAGAGKGGAGAAGQGQGGASGASGASGSGTSGSGGAGGASGSSGGAGAGGTSGMSGAAGSASGAGGSASGAGGSAGSASGGSSGTSACDDSCPFDSGVSFECKLRFMYGVNYAWQNFAADFGGDTRGVTATRSTVETELQTMAQNGVNVVRWWVWPNFTGGGVSFDQAGTPTGLRGSTLSDLETALELAEQNDLYLMLTLFSFDNFKNEINPTSQNMATIAADPAKRAALVDNVIKPFAAAAKASAHGKRVIAWDVINEPEWAVTGPSLYGNDEAFDPDDTCKPITHAQMETLLSDVIAGLRASSDALVTVGAAAMKWRHAWSMLDQDFYQFHIYDWVNMSWPYDQSPSDYGIADKPVVMGEFPPTGLSGGIDYRTLLDSWYQNGYAGALAWRDGTYKVTWSEVKAFADAHPCETAY